MKKNRFLRASRKVDKGNKQFPGEQFINKHAKVFKFAGPGGNADSRAADTGSTPRLLTLNVSLVVPGVGGVGDLCTMMAERGIISSPWKAV